MKRDDGRGIEGKFVWPLCVHMDEVQRLPGHNGRLARSQVKNRS
jgi:hypothetical protein